MQPPNDHAQSRRPISFGRVGGVVYLLILTGCASVPPDQRDPVDPYQRFNRSMYHFNDDLDRVIMKPVADAYTRTLPQPVRTGISNFYNNITYLDTTLNSFLQGKVAQGTSDLGRFVVNTTIGVAGFFDVATPIGLKMHEEDFGQTLAVWGANEDAYLTYPVWGPSSVRDTGSILVGWATNPIFYATAPVAVPLGILHLVDLRARHEGFVRFRNAAALDPYSFTRDSYLQHREFEIHDGNPPRQTIYEELLEATPPSGESQQAE